MRSGAIVGKMPRLWTMEPRVKSIALEVTELGNVQALAPQHDRKQWVHPPGQQSSSAGLSFASGAAGSVHAASSLQHSSSTRLVAIPMLAPMGSENNANAKTRRRWMGFCAADIRPLIRRKIDAWMLTRGALAIKAGSSASQQARIMPRDRPLQSVRATPDRVRTPGRRHSSLAPRPGPDRLPAAPGRGGGARVRFASARLLIVSVAPIRGVSLEGRARTEIR